MSSFCAINFILRIIIRVRNKWIALFVGFKKTVVDEEGGDKNWKRQEKDPRAQRGEGLTMTHGDLRGSSKSVDLGSACFCPPASPIASRHPFLLA